MTLPAAELAEPVTNPGQLRVDGTRLLAELDALAGFGRDSAGGMSRLGFGAADNAARQYLRQLADGAGLSSRVDQAGNVFFHRSAHGDWPPRRPVLLMGSHLDSVPRGGHLDGAYGVIAALEVLRVLTENAVELAAEPIAVAFANEEGALFPQPFWGSMAIAGQLTDPESAVDRFGNSIRGPLAEAGGELASIGQARWPAGSMASFLELHIEQGPVLEGAHVPIGVVGNIVGRTIIEIAVHGSQNHAGTTPMHQRRDALAAAAELVIEVESLAGSRQLCAVSTVGVLQVSPGQTNVVPGLVELTAEIRDGEQQSLRRAESALYETIHRIADEREVSVEARTTMRSTPVATAEPARAAIQDAATELGLPWLAMDSGAGHDAQIIAATGPVGMIFVPSRNGISHAPEEYTEPDQLVAGANVLLHAALKV
ncbi:MAG: Zn-dependent hydrolase [Actinomycetota bacterium]|nr:Zn-dependent hydrolase [Actinomycetota bacterium]MDQ2955639.1 Zn-dependent hydrolase [Actinomycetota bacterium]